ncbi:alkyl hydroperoxide reductase subunit F [Celerinatantimonas yamalensis]|uniref:Alkyl hydroperoxide reductase subunit F n=1 Tax=Celerinatantimonas yamalensis TaxID=559956 RepID=A0ABW9G7B5_9GAMM
MLDSKVKKQLDTYFQNIVHPIEIKVFTDQSNKAAELAALGQEVSELSDQIKCTVVAADGFRAPMMQIAPLGEKARVTFAGVPMGHEFTSFVLALLQAGGHPSKADVATIDQARSIKQELHFEVYVSLTCQNCPEVVQALNLFANLNPNVTSTMIDGALFKSEVERRNIMAVPTVYLNGEEFGQGRMSLNEILNKVDSGASVKQAQELSTKEPFDVLVVGGGPAGAAAAIYAARKGIRTGIVADRFGGQVLDTMAIENFISVSATEGPKLVANLEQHVLDYDVDLITTQRVAKLEKHDLIEVTLDNGGQLKSKAVILATGARWREMNVPGEQLYRGKGVAYCPHCDGPLFKGKRVAVIGGGNSGIEAAIDLAGIVEHVTVLEFSDTLRADAVLIKKAQSLANVTIMTQAMTTEVIGDGQRVIGLNYKNRTNGDAHLLDVAGIFVQIGLVPNSEWLRDTLELTERGEIVTDAHGQTSLAGVFAAGDVTHSPYKQIIISMGSGASAALGAFDYLIRQ